MDPDWKGKNAAVKLAWLLFITNLCLFNVIRDENVHRYAVSKRLSMTQKSMAYRDTTYLFFYYVSKEVKF